jgi:hypothetical protein
MTGIVIGAGIDRNCELRFNLNLRSKTEMSDGAELGLVVTLRTYIDINRPI